MSNQIDNYNKAFKINKKHKNSNSKHIMLKKDYQNFSGFSENEIWGEFEDFDYEKWLKEK